MKSSNKLSLGLTSTVGVYLMLSLGVAEARLGETLEELKARFGDVQSERNDPTARHVRQFIFLKNGIYVQCSMYQQKCLLITYHNENDSSLDSEIVAKLLAVNSFPDHPFKSQTSTKWVSKDGDATREAVLAGGGKLLMVVDALYYEVKKRSDKKTVDEF